APLQGRRHRDRIRTTSHSANSRPKWLPRVQPHRGSRRRSAPRPSAAARPALPPASLACGRMVALRIIPVGPQHEMTPLFPVLELGVWNLELGVSLVLGAWRLLLAPAPPPVPLPTPSSRGEGNTRSGALGGKPSAFPH